ncbi:MAG: hypothetical protein IJP14_06085 [Clostridia bacterium]|nr:hypothetical protein [Clostridia bacterium]
MSPSYYVPIIVLLIVLYILRRNQRAAVIRKIMKKRKTEDKTSMTELAKKFINKECLIYAFDGNHQFTGVVKEVSDGAVLIEQNGQTEAINLDFVIRIREHPTNKKGKKKSVVLD